MPDHVFLYMIGRGVSMGRITSAGVIAALLEPAAQFSEVAELDLRLLPPVMVELASVPPTSRIGPVILDERLGKRYRQREFARRFREVARGAGVPDDI